MRQVATTLAATLQRSDDVVARYGGEEFIALLGCDEKGAEVVANRMRLAVTSLEIPHATSITNATVSVSIGLATASGQKATDFASLIEAADEALYRAKQSGRNKVESWRPKPALSMVINH